MFVRLTAEQIVHPVDFRSHFPEPERPLEVDIGCGKGRFLLSRASTHREVNYLGVDRMLGRLNKISRKAARAGLEHVRLLRFDAFYATTHLIPPASVSAYYVFFPDPWPKVRHHRHRLFNEPFMDALYRTLLPDGMIHAATDHLPYFGEIARILLEDPRFECMPVFLPDENERTDFELMFKGTKAIGRCSFRLRESAPAQA